MLGSGRARLSEEPSSTRLRPGPLASLLVVGMAATLAIGAAQPYSNPLLVAESTGTPAKLVFTDTPGGGAPGEAFAVQPEVEVQDAAGDAVSTDGLDVVLTLVQGAALQGTLTCTDTSLPSTTGAVAFAGCKVDRGGSFKLKATLGTLTPVESGSFFISGPAYLLFSPSPGAATAGTVFPTIPRVSMVDGNGTAIAGSDVSGVGIVVKPGTGTAGASLTCVGAQAAGSTGIVKNLPTADLTPPQYTGCKIDRAGTGYRLLAYDDTTKLIGTSDAFDVVGGTSAGLAFSRQPIGSPLGGFAVQPQVTVTDAGGNPVVGDTGTVTLGLAGTGPATAALSGCTSTRANGVTIFAGCQVDRAGSGYTLTATHSAGTAVSAPFSIVAGAGAVLSFATQPGSGASGSALTAQPVVQVIDSAGVAATAAVTLTLQNANGASLACAATTVPTTGGLATFEDCTVDQVGTYTLRATAGTATATSASFTIGAGSVHRLVFDAAPADATGGSSFGTQPVVKVLDVGGNPAAATVALSLAPGLGTDGAALDCADETINSGSDGVATFSGCDIDLAGEGYRLRATVAGVPTAIDTSEPFTVATGPATQLAFRTSPGGGTGGTAWEQQPVVTVEDAGGNRVVGSNAKVALSILQDSGPGTLVCGTDPAPVERGAAVLTGCSIDLTGAAYRLRATAAGLTSATSAAFAVTAGPATQLVFTTQPSNGEAGQSLAGQPVVRVADAGGNPAGTGPTTVALAVTSGTGTAGGALGCADNSKGTSGGVATFSGCSVQSAGGGYTLTATAGSLRRESAPFGITPPPPGPMELAPASVPLEQTFGGRLYGTNPTATVDGVNSASGSLVHPVLDLTVAGVGADLELERTYNSADATTGAFGRGWSSVLDASVRLAPGAVPTTATVRGEDGQRLVFTWSAATGTWTAPPGATATLKCSSKTCTVKRSDGMSFTSEGGRITSWLEPFGRGLRFSYDAAGRLTAVLIDMADPKKPRTIAVSTDAAGHVTRLQTPALTSVAYTYAGDSLVGVRDVRGNDWSYSHAGALLSGISVGGTQRLQVTYAGSGRVATLKRTGSPDHVDARFAWDAATRTATRSVHVSVDGELTWADYVDRYVANSLVHQSFPTGAVVRYAYDARTNLVRVQDPAGWVQEMAYDALGNLTFQRTPITSTTAAVARLTYDADSRVLTQTDANGHTVTYVYNGSGIGAITPPGSGSGSTRFAYNGLGLLTSVTTPTGRQVFGYDDAGNQTRVQAETLPGTPLTGAGSLMTYDEAGRLLTSTDARGTTRRVSGFTTTRTYDKAGNLLTTAAPGRGTTTSSYDAAGRVTSSSTPQGTTTFSWEEGDLTRRTTTDGKSAVQVYDPSGNVLVEETPAGQRTTHRYDALGRETATVTEAATVRYSYDASSNVVSIADSAGATTDRQFDSLNRVVRSVTDGAETLSRYDADGNLLTERNAAGATTTRTYDSHRNLTRVTDPAGTTSYAYDLSDNVVRRTDGKGGVTAYTYDGLGHVLSETVDGGTTTHGYDEAGNRVRTTDPVGRVTQLTLDGANRTTRRVHSGVGSAITVDQGFDSLGRRTSVTTGGATRTSTYDEAGNLTSAQTPGGTFSYDRSTSGKVVETYPDGTKVDYTVDDGGNLMSLASGSGTSRIEASYIRDAKRRTTGLALSNGVLQTRAYDGDGNVVHQAVQRGGTVLTSDDYGYDGSGNRLWQRTKSAAQTVEHAYGYDTTNRLTAFVRNTSPGTGVVPATAVGAATSTTPVDTEAVPYTPVPAAPAATPVAAPTEPTLGYDAIGNRTSPNDGTTRTYDRSGALTRSTGPGGTSEYSYDAAARLVRAVVAAGGTTRTVTYAYDADGNRIRRTVDGAAATEFAWSPFGELPLLAQERIAGGAVTKTYFNGEGPVAVRSAQSTLFFSLDPIGSTRSVTDEDGDLVASYEYGAFGVLMETGTAAAAVDLLFQGQQLDRVTGLYNMRKRNYDPASGRFTQREPLETAVGTPYVSPWAFVGNRPTVLTDPTGFAPEITATTVFAGQSSEDANAASQAKIAATATKLTFTGLGKTSYFAGAAARAAAVGAESSKAAKFATFMKVAGHGLTIAGIALQTYMAVENCKHGTIYKCVGSATGLAINVAFTVGCSTITAGAGSAGGCAIVGAILSIAMEFVIAQYGPDIVAGVLEVAGIVGPWVSDVALSIELAFADAGGEIVSGFNTAVAALSTGYAEALATLTEAGLTVVQLAEVLSEGFDLGYRETVAGVLALGYDIAAAAEALSEVLETGFLDAANVLRDEFNGAAAEVGAALKDAYALTETALIQALDQAGYAVDEVVATLEEVYEQTFDGVLLLLDAAGYTADQIAAAAQDVFNTADQAVAAALQEIGVLVEDLAGVLRDVCGQADAAVAATLKELEYTATQVADALIAAYADSAAVAAQVMAGAQFVAGEVAGALEDAYGASAQLAAQLLKDADFAVAEVAAALSSAYDQTVAEAAALLQGAGYLAQEIASGIEDAFDATATAVAGILADLSYTATEVANALEGAFTGLTDAAIAGLLDALSYTDAQVAAALEQALDLGVAAVAGLLEDLGYTATQLGNVLLGVFGQTAAEAAALLETLDYTIAQIGDVLNDVFVQGAAAAAAILEDIGAAAAEVASILQDAFGQSEAVIAGLLGEAGYLVGEIEAVGGVIGGALESAANEVAAWFDSWW